MFTSAMFISLIGAVCLLLAAALLTAWNEFRPGRHVLAWAFAFVAAAAAHAILAAPTQGVLWQVAGPTLLSLVISTGFASIAWGFRARVGAPTRFVAEIWTLTALLLGVLRIYHGDGWRAGSYLLTVLGGIAMIAVVVGTLRGKRGTVRLARGVFILYALYMVELIVLQHGSDSESSKLTLALHIGTPLGIIGTGILTLLIVSADLAAELRVQARTDTLTGLLNRRGFEHHVHEWKSRRKKRQPMLVVLADLDRFKTINDTLGHAAGDAVLRRFARQLQAALQPGEIAARIGGEEFVLLLPGIPLDDGVDRVERIRRAVPATLQDLAGIDHVTASFGVATLHPNEDLAAALARADVALYRSKNEGRDRITTEAA